MDSLFAPIYNQEWGAVIAPTHHRCRQRFLSLFPPQATILDAASSITIFWFRNWWRANLIVGRAGSMS